MDIHPKELTGLVAVVLIFGGGVLWGIIATIADNWRKTRVAEQNAVLKAKMLERGFSADEIVQVLNANGGGKTKMAERAPHHAKSA
jgi:hypothetical protein